MNALPPVHVVVLISGSGTNLQALLDATATPGSPLHGRCRVVGVVSNRKAAFGLERAARAGVPTRVLTLKSYRDAGRSRLDYDRDLAQLVMAEEWGAQVVVLAGFMHIVSQPFLDALPPGRVINLHPALPGEFDGVRAIERAFEAYQAGTLTRTGVMVHRVIPDVDRGEVIVKCEVPIFPKDTIDTLSERMHAVEHTLIVQGLLHVVEEVEKEKKEPVHDALHLPR